MPESGSKLAKLVAAFRQGGFRHVRRVVNTYFLTRETRRLEDAHSLDLIDPVMLEEMSIESEHREHGFFYAATPVRCIHALIESVPGPLEGQVFIDLGSGKGVALLVAAQYPFREVVGVEFGQELHEIAHNNIQRYSNSARRCQEVRSVCQDAAAFELPAEDCVVFLCNPFAEPVMEKVLANLHQAKKSYGKQIFVLYQQLKVEDAISRAETVALFKRSPCLREHPVHYRSLADRVLLAHLDMRVYEVVDIA